MKVYRGPFIKMNSYYFTVSGWGIPPTYTPKVSIFSMFGFCYKLLSVTSFAKCNGYLLRCLFLLMLHKWFDYLSKYQGAFFPYPYNPCMLPWPKFASFLWYRHRWIYPDMDPIGNTLKFCKNNFKGWNMITSQCEKEKEHAKNKIRPSPPRNYGGYLDVPES